MSTLTYAPAKAGVISITKALAKSYPSVRFNVVAPRYVETDQVNDWNEETFKRINDGTILGRIAKPEEIAPLVMFLASDEATNFCAERTPRHHTETGQPIGFL